MEVDSEVQNWLLQNLSDVLNCEGETATEPMTSSTAWQSQSQGETSRTISVQNDPLTAEGLCSSAPMFLRNGDRLQSAPQDSEFNPKERMNSFSVSHESSQSQALKAQREWQSAIASLENLLLSQLNLAITCGEPKRGVIFSAPVPILCNLALINNFSAGVFTPNVFQPTALMPCNHSVKTNSPTTSPGNSLLKLPLLPNDPIAREQFGLIFTANFALVILLGQDSQGMPKFHFSFAPETIERVWLTLRARLLLTKYNRLAELDELIKQFKPINPDYRIVTDFSRQLLANIPDLSTMAVEKVRQMTTINHSQTKLAGVIESTVSGDSESEHQEIELLQALTHEIRTPLTTIRTLTKLLLKRKQDLKQNAIKRLQAIDQECTEQIERMELIFRAAELESTPTAKPVELVPFPLEQVFQQCIPRWQQKAQRRNVQLEVTLPPRLPKIVSDPAMLDRVLTGLVESCTRSLPTGGQIQIKVSTAGDRLKLQVLSQHNDHHNPLKALGQLLMFQPETGCLSLNLDVTKNIFQALGGKLTVRQRAKQGEELTIFLPLGNSNPQEDLDLGQFIVDC